jgi:LacI family transcriptional regulator
VSCFRKLADELGYIPNENARVLAGERSKTIGIILPEIDCNYYASVVGCIENKLKLNGYSLIIGQTGFEYANELHYLKLFTGKNLDGMIIDLYNAEEFIQHHSLIKNIIKVPVVFIESPCGLSEYDAIEIDNRYGVELAINHLVSLGHRRIGFVGEAISSRIRLPAFISALEKNGILPDRRLIRDGKERLEEGGYLRMRELLNLPDPPTAVFASYDTMAHGALKAIAEHGLKVPGDISVVGFDNIRESAFFNVPLTTVAPPVMEMGENAVSLLLDKAQNSGGCRQHISMKPKLVVRGSTAAPRPRES